PPRHEDDGANRVRAGRTSGRTMTRPTSGILYADGDAEARVVLPRFLARCGPLRVAATLAEAMAAVEEQCPDLLVVDPALPDGCGLGLADELRRRSPWAQIFVVCGSDGSSDVSRFIAHGAGDVEV